MKKRNFFMSNILKKTHRRTVYQIKFRTYKRIRANTKQIGRNRFSITAFSK